MKKSLKILTITALALGFGAGCSKETGSLLASQMDSSDQVVAFSALATTNVLSTFATSQTPLNQGMNGPGGPLVDNPSIQRGGLDGLIDRMLNRNQVTLSEEQINEIGQYVNVFETLLTGEQNPIESEVVTSDDHDYAFKMTITTKTIDLATIEYTMYFNEVITDTGEEVDLQERQDRVSTDLEGILLVGDDTYVVAGKKVITDRHSLVTFTSKIDEDNYVRISELIVNNRRQFNYTVVVDGEIVSQSKIRFAKVNQKETIFLETTTNGEKESYRFTRFVKDEETWIHLMVGNGINMKNVFIRITIDPDTGEEIYAYYAGNQRLGKAMRMIKQKFAQNQG